MRVLPNDIKEICDNLTDLHPLLEGKHILLTGARGFLGKYFMEVVHLLNTKYLKWPCTLTALDNNICSSGDVVVSTYISYQDHNIIQPFQKSLIKVDYIFYCAGIASPYWYKKYPLETIDVATTGLKNCLEMARQHDAKLLWFSSSEVYGNPPADQIPTTEEYNGDVPTMKDRSCYDISKKMGETLVYTYHTLYNTHASVIRPFNFYGPLMTPNDHRVMPNFAARIQKGLPLELYGTGQQTRTMCYITDGITGAFRTLLQGRPNQAYNIGASNPEISMLDLTRKIQELVDPKIEVKLTPYPEHYAQNEPMRRCGDFTKAKRELNFEAKVSLDDGIKRFFGWSNEAYANL
jgi:UDP-glucuronate decarboxylase